MITLITGVPGAGKTSEAVAVLLSTKGQRYTVGCPVKGIAEIEFANVMSLKNATVLIDEAHFFLNNAEFLNFLTVHRHSGLDFIFTTQDFSLLPRKVLPLVAKHKHLSVNPLGERRILEWDRYGNPRSSRDVEAAHKTFGKVNRSSWGSFDSVKEGADMPAVKKGRKSKKLIVFVVLPFILAAGLFAFGNVKSLAPLYGGEKWEATVPLPPKAASEPLPTIEPPQSSPPPLELKTLELPQEEEKPEEGKENIVGCVRNNKTCTCYTTEAKPIRSETECSLRGI